jgi:wyosine [tRNA(Phe)-imidazoG37] synthetase (radical SAM superfamily)
MKYVFGPVPSRRLGRSLGIDPVPFKTCNLSCVYCQLGRTSPRTYERGEYCPTEEIINEVSAALAAHAEDDIDWLTFVGSGEPTLHSRLGEMIHRVKALSPIPVAVITNGSLLHRPEVREELLAADALLPSLDAGSAELFARINRPAEGLTFGQLVSGLVAFRRAYRGRLLVEVMLLKGVNDTVAALRDLAAVLRRIDPDEIHVSFPTRPPAEDWVEPPDNEGLMRATALLGDVARLVPTVTGSFDLSGFARATDAVVHIISRHPMREQELVQALTRWQPDQVDEALAELVRSGRAQVVTRYGQRFWSCAGARYVDGAVCESPDDEDSP